MTGRIPPLPLRWIAGLALLCSACTVPGCALPPRVDYVASPAVLQPAGSETGAREISTFTLPETWIQLSATADGTCCDVETSTAPSGDSISVRSRGLPILNSGLTIVHTDYGHMVRAVVIGGAALRDQAGEPLARRTMPDLRRQQSGESGTVLPCYFNASRTLRRADASRTVRVHQCLGTTITLGDVPDGIVPLADIETLNAGPHFLFPTCREVEVTIANGRERHSRTLLVSDPRYLQRLRMPASGVILANDICGTKVVPEVDGDITQSSGIFLVVKTAIDTLFRLVSTIIPL